MRTKKEVNLLLCLAFGVFLVSIGRIQDEYWMLADHQGASSSSSAWVVNSHPSVTKGDPDALTTKNTEDDSRRTILNHLPCRNLDFAPRNSKAIVMYLAKPYPPHAEMTGIRAIRNALLSPQEPLQQQQQDSYDIVVLLQAMDRPPNETIYDAPLILDFVREHTHVNQICVVPRVLPPKQIPPIGGWARHSFTKLHLFGMTFYEQILFLDATALPLQWNDKTTMTNNWKNNDLFFSFDNKDEMEATIWTRYNNFKAAWWIRPNQREYVRFLGLLQQSKEVGNAVADVDEFLLAVYSGAGNSRSSKRQHQIIGNTNVYPFDVSSAWQQQKKRKNKNGADTTKTYIFRPTMFSFDTSKPWDLCQNYAEAKAHGNELLQKACQWWIAMAFSGKGNPHSSSSSLQRDRMKQQSTWHDLGKPLRSQTQAQPSTGGDSSAKALFRQKLAHDIRVHHVGPSVSETSLESHSKHGPATIVTQYFYLRESKHSTTNHDGTKRQNKKNHYESRGWISNFLSLNDPMVIFTSSELVESMARRRTHAPTVIVEVELDDLPVVHLANDAFLPQANQRRGAHHFWTHQLNIDPEKDVHKTFKLFWIWLSKAWLTVQAIQRNYFGSQFYYYCDIGSFRDPSYNGKQVVSPHIMDDKNLIPNHHTTLWMSTKFPKFPSTLLMTDKAQLKESFFHAGAHGAGFASLERILDILCRNSGSVCRGR